MKKALALILTVAMLLSTVAIGASAARVVTEVPGVVDKAWYGEAIRWAADIGIVEGYGSNLFGTTDDITREQLAVFLYRYEQYMSEDSGETQTFDLDFADTESVSPWAQEALSWMVENGIMEGKDGIRLDPRGTATRAEIATVLFRYVTLKTQK